MSDFRAPVFNEYPTLAARLLDHIGGPWNSPLTVAHCWPWLGRWRSRYGYGRIRFGGRGSPNGVAHRLMWELLNGPMPDGLIGCHGCNWPPCCNPYHTYPGTHRRNRRDQLEGRHD